MPFFCHAQGVESQKKNITGIYSSMGYVRNAGDLVGVEVFLVNTNDGIYAVFQSAEGGAASVPVVVKAFVIGNKIEFTLPENSSFPGKFIGRLEKSRIVGEFERGYLSPTRPGTQFVLHRRKSYWQQ